MIQYLRRDAKKLFQRLFIRKENLQSNDSAQKENWEIKIVLSRDKQTFFESEVKYEYLIINKQNKEVVKIYYRDEYENSEGSSETGVKDVFL